MGLIGCEINAMTSNGDGADLSPHDATFAHLLTSIDLAQRSSGDLEMTSTGLAAPSTATPELWDSQQNFLDLVAKRLYLVPIGMGLGTALGVIMWVVLAALYGGSRRATKFFLSKKGEV